jgi:hypothetical protein
MSEIIRHIALQFLNDIITEQAAAKSAPLETDNSKTDAGDSPFTPAEKKFLGKFDAYGSKNMGIIYSISDIGIREFITRSGKDFNLSPAILIRLLRDKIIKIVPYTGYGRDDSYTLELQLPLEDIEGFGDADKKNVEKGSEASGAPAAGGAPPPAPELAWVIRYGDLLKESSKIAKQLILEKNTTKTETKFESNALQLQKSRILKKLPKQYIKHLDQLVLNLSKTKYSSAEKQRLLADIIDKLMVNLKLSDKQIEKSYFMHKKQQRMHDFLNTK